MSLIYIFLNLLADLDLVTYSVLSSSRGPSAHTNQGKYINLCVKSDDMVPVPHV